MHTPELELLWWEGCPSTERALSELRHALTDLHLDGAEVRMREIRTDAEAAQSGFIGSPTILIDGEDVESSALRAGGGDAPVIRPGDSTSPVITVDDPIGLNCRIYRRRDGRISPTPDPDDLREALKRAAERLEVTR
jgi:glutaredoxin